MRSADDDETAAKAAMAATMAAARASINAHRRAKAQDAHGPAACQDAAHAPAAGQAAPGPAAAKPSSAPVLSQGVIPMAVDDARPPPPRMHDCWQQRGPGYLGLQQGRGERRAGLGILASRVGMGILPGCASMRIHSSMCCHRVAAIAALAAASSSEVGMSAFD
jgi:hypothetical protein